MGSLVSSQDISRRRLKLFRRSDRKRRRPRRLCASSRAEIADPYPLKDLSASVSVVWSDDRHSFAVTWSDGGAIGAFSVRVFHVEADSVSELPAWEKAWTEFKKRHWCRTRGDNIQAYSWLPDSKQLILVLSVYPTGDCGADLGHTEAYVVNAKTGEIEQNWSIKKLNAYMRLHPE